ncbi:MAG: right-handed parallel beta-helix repeat-containing protein [Thermoguttaceae bacterium]|nr:right-handed parallel beta-helix repeat-containing protein [Thermoguttaceae bacterium]
MIVLDCGGGTVDWACLRRLADNQFELIPELPPGGDNRIGGMDIDQNILDWLRDHLEDGARPSLERNLAAVLDGVRRIKENYCRTGSGGKIRLAGQSISIPKEVLQQIITGRFVEQICEHLSGYLSRVREQLKLDRPTVLLIGGSARIPELQEVLREKTGCEPIWWERSEYATVLGALERLAQGAGSGSLVGQAQCQPVASARDQAAKAEARPLSAKPPQPKEATSLKTVRPADLAELLAQAKPGETIHLPRGNYPLPGPLVISKPICLVGAGENQTFFLGDGPGAVLEYTGEGLLALAKLSIIYTGQQPGNGLVVSSGKIEITNVWFEGAKGAEDASIQGAGLLVCGSATGTVGPCLFKKNTQGIIIEGSAQVVVESSRCEENQNCGILYQERASGTARKNTCRKNTRGIVAIGQAKLSLEENCCEENKGGGIAYGESASGMARKNTCRKNAGGISAIGQAKLSLEENCCEENKESGIQYQDSASGTARKNTCRKNAGGILAAGQAKLSLEENCCEENKENGIQYQDSASGTARKNTCRKNKMGIVAGGQAKISLEENCCEENQNCGIEYWESASGTARKNTCRKNGWGIRAIRPGQA